MILFQLSKNKKDVLIMNINRPELKMRSKGMMNVAKPSPITVGMVYLAVTILISLLSAKLLGASLTQNDINQILTHCQNGNYDYAMTYLTDYLPPVSSYFIDALLEVATWILYAGFTIFILNTVRGTNACYGNLLDGFGLWWRIILLKIVTGIFVFLWSLLLFVPGVIAEYRYRMAIYILIDHPEMSVMDCIRESKRMMSGHKWELFILDLSFIGWTILSSISMVGWFVSIFTTPYFALTYAQYYELISGHATVQYSNV